MLAFFAIFHYITDAFVNIYSRFVRLVTGSCCFAASFMHAATLSHVKQSLTQRGKMTSERRFRVCQDFNQRIRCPHSTTQQLQELLHQLAMEFISNMY